MDLCCLPRIARFVSTKASFFGAIFGHITNPLLSKLVSVVKLAGYWPHSFFFFFFAFIWTSTWPIKRLGQ